MATADLIEGRMPTLVAHLRVLGIVLTVACLVLGAYVVDWRRMLQVIAGADLGLIGMASLCQAVGRRHQLGVSRFLPPLHCAYEHRRRADRRIVIGSQ